MVNKNIQMKQKNGDSWDNLFPITLTENVFNETGNSLDSEIERLDQKDDDIETEIVRLDQKDENLTTQLTETENEIRERGVSVYDFKHFIPNYESTSIDEWDWSPAIEKAIQVVKNQGGGTILFPNRRMYISRTVVIDSPHIVLKGQGTRSELWFTGDVFNSGVGNNGLAIIRYLAEPAKTGCVIENILLNGDHKTLWGVYAEFTYGLQLRNVRIKRTAGFIYTKDCYNSHYVDVFCEYSTKERPTQMPVSDWESVINNGLIYTLLGNGDHFENIKVLGFGTIDDPIRSVFNLNGNVIKVSSVVIERDNLYLDGLEDIPNKKISTSHLFWVTGSNISIDSLYLEHFNSLCLLTSTAQGTHQINLNNVFVNLANIFYTPIQILAGRSITVGKVSIYSSYLQSTGEPLVFATVPSSLINIITSPITWFYGRGVDNVKTINGKAYSDQGVDSFGMRATNAYVVKSETQGHERESGLNVTDGTDDIGYYIAVDPGTISNQNGEIVQLGANSTGNRDIGWLLRPKLTTNSTYDVYVDVYGGVFVERSIYASPMRTGKIRLKRLTIGSTLDDKTWS